MASSGSLHSLTRAPRAAIFGVAWLFSTLILGWLLIQVRPGFDSSVSLYAMGALLLCTFGLLWWLRNPIPAEGIGDLVAGQAPTRTFRLVLLILAACAVLFPLRTLVGTPLLFGLPVLAVFALIGLHQPIPQREIAYTSGLAVLAGIAGLGAGWIKGMSLLLWGGLQVLLTLAGLLAGWAILRSSRLVECGVGRSQFLETGPVPALKAAGIGILLGIPWGLGLVLMGSAQSETWVHAWWQPLTAIQPGIAEEAWGRILLVSLLFLLFRLAASPRAALGAALIVAAYWFAYLHTPGGFASISGTLITGTLYALPVSYLCLYRNLETAIGFHFFLDFFKFLWALLFL